MRIYLFVDVYPHFSKPYFDVQIEEWVRDGHDLRVFSTSRADGALAPVPVTTVQTIREAPLRLIFLMGVSVLRNPLRALRVAGASGSPVQALKNLVLDAQMPLKPPDVCLIHTLAAAVRWQYLRSAFPGSRLAVYYHGGEIVGVREIDAGVAARALRSVEIVFSNTEFSVAHAVSRGARPESTRKVPVGFRVSDFKPVMDRERCANGTVRMVAAGRMAEEKAFDVALRAFASLRRRGRGITFTLIGSGPRLPHLQELAAQLGIDDAVVFRGNIPYQEVLAEIGRGDVLVLSSIRVNTWEENQACVMQEAMLLGLPVVASRTGGIPESLPECMHPYMFEPGDVAGLEASLLRLMDEGPARFAQLGTEGRRFAERRYDIAVTNQEILKHVS